MIIFQVGERKSTHLSTSECVCCLHTAVSNGGRLFFLFKFNGCKDLIIAKEIFDLLK